MSSGVVFIRESTLSLTFCCRILYLTPLQGWAIIRYLVGDRVTTDDMTLQIYRGIVALQIYQGIV